MMITAKLIYWGMPDYWGGNGRRWDDGAGCLFAYYDGKTTLKGLIENAVDDYCMGGDFEPRCSDNDPWAEITDNDVRAALLECLSDSGRADYESDAISEFAEEYANINGFNHCRECGEPVGSPHNWDCALLEKMAENGDIDDNFEVDVNVEEGDCEPDYEYTDSPVCIFLLELE